MTVRTEAGKMLIGAIVADELLGDPRGYVFEIERQARAAALREVAEPLIDLFDRATMPGDDSTPLYDYLGDDARATVDKARAILTEATDTSATRAAGASE